MTGFPTPVAQELEKDRPHWIDPRTWITDGRQENCTEDAETWAAVATTEGFFLLTTSQTQLVISHSSSITLRLDKGRVSSLRTKDEQTTKKTKDTWAESAHNTKTLLRKTKKKSTRWTQKKDTHWKNVELSVEVHERESLYDSTNFEPVLILPVWSLKLVEDNVRRHSV